MNIHASFAILLPKSCLYASFLTQRTSLSQTVYFSLLVITKQCSHRCRLIAMMFIPFLIIIGTKINSYQHEVYCWTYLTNALIFELILCEHVFIEHKNYLSCFFK